MQRPLIALVAALALTAPTRAEESAPRPAPAETGGHDSFSGGGMSVPRASRLPGFAAELAQRPSLIGPDAWRGDTSWSAIARSSRANRQAARWDRARGLIGHGRAAEALGVLAAMRIDDPDLNLIPTFHLAEGVAFAQLRRWEDALAALSGPELAGNSEACAWRLRALSEAQLHEQALNEVSCALTAINARRNVDRDVFLRAAAGAAIDAGRAGAAMQWLRPIDDRDPAANLLRGRAYVALGEYQAGRLRLERALVSGTPEQRADARLAMLEAEIRQGSLPPAQALEKLDALRFGWRGGPVEERALRLSLTLASDAHDVRATLRSGAALFRYFEPGRDAASMLAKLQAALGTALAPDSPLPLAEAAGVYWDYRELAPAGAEGDRLVNRLADRLQAAGLYGRAAELLGYQLTRRAEDVAQGPLSVKVATLHLLAGRPDRALGAVRDTEQAGYSDAMRWDRKRMEAVALYQLGRPQAAVAALDGVPDANALRAEFQWRRNAWGAFVSTSAGQLPAGNRLDEAGQAAVLRQAVALAMLGRESELQALRARYAAAFESLPSAGVFDVLTRAAGSVDPAAVSEAMAKIPSASPAGQIADLIDAAPQSGG